MSLVRQLEPPTPLPQRARKRPFLMAEEFRFQQRFRKRGAADLDQGIVASAGCSDGWRWRPALCRFRSRPTNQHRRIRAATSLIFSSTARI